LPCSEAGKYHWCEALPFYEVEGKDYCVFHAPQGHKKTLINGILKDLSLEEFNKLVFERIYGAKKNRVPLKIAHDLCG